MNKKKLVSLCLVLALLVTAAVGATFAYFTDTDSATNVMTTGNVNIIQNEKDKAGNDFKQDQPLMPMVDTKEEGDPLFEDGFFNKKMLNVIDKVVTVTNEAKEGALNQDVYVRTILAFETNNEYVEGTDEVLRDAETIFNTYIGVLGKGLTYTKDIIEVEGVKYLIAYRVYEEKLIPGATTEPSLKQIFMSPDADNEVAKLFGDEYTVLALSQATQTAGFDTAEEALNAAFGEITVGNAQTWFEDVE